MRIPGSRTAIAWAVAVLIVAAFSPATAQGQSVTYAYDALGRITQATYQNGAVVTYTYDAAGSMIAVEASAPPNLPPVATNDTVSTGFNTPVSFDPRANDSDPESGALTIVSVTAPSSGTAVVTGGGTGVTYTPASDFVGSATFSYTVRDPQNATATATVSVTVTNQSPVAVNDATSTNSNTAKSFDPRANDGDPEGGALTIVSVTTPSSGTAIVTGAGTGVTYTPASNFIGTATFSYTVRDPQNATATATVTVTVNNQAPVAQADSVSTAYNTSVTFDPRGNDSDPEGGALTVDYVTPPSFGGSTSANAASITFTPASGFSGTTSFVYAVRDPQNAVSSPATVTVTVAPAPNFPPNAFNDVVNAEGPANETFELEIDVLANDSDPNGDPLTVISVTQPSGGQGITSISNNVIVYGSLFNNTFANFSYTISDGRGGTSTANVALQISRY